MAMTDRLSVDTVSAPPSRGVAEIVVTAFVGVLALAMWAPTVVTAALGVALLAVGFLMATGLWLARVPLSKPSAAWDVAAAAIFLGFVATLVSDAIVPPL